MKSIRLAYKLILTSLIPLSGLLVYASISIADNFKTVRISSLELQLTGLIQASKSLVHELQIERGMSFHI